MADITIYPDEDWTVDSTHGPDVSAVTLTAPDGSEVRFEASYKVLRALAERWQAEVYNNLDFEVAGNGRNPDAISALFDLEAQEKWRAKAAALVNPDAPTLDKIDEKIDNLEKLLTERNGGDDARYPADMVVGDWVRFPPSHSWRLIHSILADRSEISYQYGGRRYDQKVRPSMRYPYMSAAAMADVPEQEG